MTRPIMYKLKEDGTIEPCKNTLDWAEWFEKETYGLCRVAFDDPAPGVEVSTVFLGVDHNHFGEGPPILFETMVFGGPLHHYQARYATKEEALKGHSKALLLVWTAIKTGSH